MKATNKFNNASEVLVDPVQKYLQLCMEDVGEFYQHISRSLNKYFDKSFLAKEKTPGVTVNDDEEDEEYDQEIKLGNLHEELYTRDQDLGVESMSVLELSVIDIGKYLSRINFKKK